MHYTASKEFFICKFEHTPLFSTPRISTVQPVYPQSWLVLSIKQLNFNFEEGIKNYLDILIKKIYEGPYTIPYALQAHLPRFSEDKIGEAIRKHELTHLNHLRKETAHKINQLLFFGILISQSFSPLTKATLLLRNYLYETYTNRIVHELLAFEKEIEVLRNSPNYVKRRMREYEDWATKNGFWYYDSVVTISRILKRYGFSGMKLLELLYGFKYRVVDSMNVFEGIIDPIVVLRKILEILTSMEQLKIDALEEELKKNFTKIICHSGNQLYELGDESVNVFFPKFSESNIEMSRIVDRKNLFSEYLKLFSKKFEESEDYLAAKFFKLPFAKLLSESYILVGEPSYHLYMPKNHLKKSSLLLKTVLCAKYTALLMMSVIEEALGDLRFQFSADNLFGNRILWPLQNPQLDDAARLLRDQINDDKNLRKQLNLLEAEISRLHI